MQSLAPVLIAYDGSEVSGPPSGTLLGFSPGVRRWWRRSGEPGLAEVPAGWFQADAIGGGRARPGSERASKRSIASSVSTPRPSPPTGLVAARSLGLVAEPQAVPDEVDVVDTLIDIAREHGAAVVVVGSHGISGLRKRLLGSVSRKLVEHCDRPVLVVRDDSA